MSLPKALTPDSQVVSILGQAEKVEDSLSGLMRITFQGEQYVAPPMWDMSDGPSKSHIVVQAPDGKRYHIWYWDKDVERYTP